MEATGMHHWATGADARENLTRILQLEVADVPEGDGGKEIRHCW